MSSLVILLCFWGPVAQSLCPFESFAQAPWTLREWGIPAALCDVYDEQFHVQKPFPWQRACLFSYFREAADVVLRSGAAVRERSGRRSTDSLEPIDPDRGILTSQRVYLNWRRVRPRRHFHLRDFWHMKAGPSTKETSHDPRFHKSDNPVQNPSTLHERRSH